MKKLHKRLMIIASVCVVIALTFTIITTTQSSMVKADVCHFGDKELVIGEAAVAAHLDHGDCLGECPCEN